MHHRYMHHGYIIMYHIFMYHRFMHHRRMHHRHRGGKGGVGQLCCLSAQRAQRTKSRGPMGLFFEVGARRTPRLLVFNNWIKRDICCWKSQIKLTLTPCLLINASSKQILIFFLKRRNTLNWGPTRISLPLSMKYLSFDPVSQLNGENRRDNNTECSSVHKYLSKI